MKRTVRMRELRIGDVLLDANHRPLIRVQVVTKSKKDATAVVRGEPLQSTTDGWYSGALMGNVLIDREEP